jgi:hypothetical protein
MSSSSAKAVGWTVLVVEHELADTLPEHRPARLDGGDDVIAVRAQASAARRICVDFPAPSGPSK